MLKPDRKPRKFNVIKFRRKFPLVVLVVTTLICHIIIPIWHDTVLRPTEEQRNAFKRKVGLIH